MKKILLSLVLSLGTLSAIPVMAAAPEFSASQMAQVKIEDLSFKEVMREFYSGDMTRINVNDDDIEAMPHVGLGGQDNSIRETTVALMHPVIAYKNIVGESRYLVTIEKVLVNEGLLVSCHSCGAKADLYSFKKLSNGQFQLVSRTPKDVEFSASWGRLRLDGISIQEGLQPLGKSLIGSVFTNGYTSTGESLSWWDVLYLPENDFINLYRLGDAGENNAGTYDEGSPLYYAYEGTFKVLSENNNTMYYPIMLTYKGEQPTEDYERIEHVNYSKIMKFNPTKKAYE